MRKTWRWIIVGDEHRTEGVTVEYAVASTWLLRVGIVAIVACVGYFLKWSMDRGLVTDVGRVAISILAGVGMVVGGVRLLGRKYHLIGQGLLGGGLVVLYFGVYAAGPMYELMPLAATFAMMILVTVAAGLLAVRLDSLLTAMLGLIGGYVTPMLLRTPEPNLPVFYAYILLLSLGVLGVARYKQWRLLNAMAFVASYALLLGSLTVYERGDFPLTLASLTALFAVHSQVVYAYNVRWTRKSTVLEIVQLAVNAGIYSFVGYWLIRDAHGRPYPALMSLGLAVFYLGHVLLFLKKGVTDRKLLVTFIALAAVFTTWTLPLVMQKESLTISFALLAFMFVWLGQRVESPFVGGIGAVLYVLVVCRVLLLDMPHNFERYPGADTTMAMYWREMTRRLWQFGISIGSVIGAFFLKRRMTPSLSQEARAAPSRGVAGSLFYWVSVVLVFLFLHLEVNAMFSFCTPVRLPVLTGLWCMAAVYFLWQYTRGPVRALTIVALWVFTVGAMAKLFVIDVPSWRLSAECIYNTEYAWLAAGMRLLDYGAVLVLLGLAWQLLIGVERKRSGALCGYVGLLLLFIYASLELNSFLFWRLPDFRAGGLSILWAAFAIAFISGGIWRSVAGLRYMGLLLFTVVAIKVFFRDLSEMEIIYRVLAFFGVGLALLLGSFAYVHSGRKFLREGQDGQEG